LYYVEVTAGALVKESGYVAQPLSTATPSRGQTMGFVTDNDIVDARGMKLHVVKTGWSVTKSIPLCQYRSEVLADRRARIEEIKEMAQREKLIELMKALTFVAAVACPLLRVGTSVWAFAKTVELAETLAVVTAVSESVLINKRESVFDVLYDVMVDSAVSQLKKTMFLGSLVSLYPTMSKRMIKFSGDAYDVWDATPDAAKVDTKSVIQRFHEDDILDDIYRFRMGMDPNYNSRMVAAVPSFEQAWKAAQAARKKEPSKVAPAALGKPQIDLQLLAKNYWPDCECDYCLTWQKADHARKQDFANRKAHYIRETE
jgi:hypothetical protein